MRKHTGSWIPAIGLTIAFAGFLTPIVLGDGPNPGGADNHCDGYCSNQRRSCGHGLMRCCCDVAGVWTCVCKAATDCNAQNDCQDGGGQGS